MALSIRALRISKGKDSAASLDNLFYCSITPIMKKKSDTGFPYSNLFFLSCILPLYNSENVNLSSLQPFFNKL